MKQRTRRQRRRARRSCKSQPFVRPCYYDYMQSKAWRAKRRDKMRAAGWKCEICGDSQQRLNVHHKHYDTLGRERMKDLQVLCEGCHRNHHEKDFAHVCDPMTAEFRALVRSF